MPKTPKLKTRCPKCNTTFNISDGHLSKARGLVRCGSCLQIFDAAKNIVYNTGEQPQTQSQQLPPSAEDNSAENAASEATKASPGRIKKFKQHLSNKADALQKLGQGTGDSGDSAPKPFSKKNLAESNADEWVVELIQEFEDSKNSDSNEPEQEKPVKTEKPDVKANNKAPSKVEKNSAESTANPEKKPSKKSAQKVEKKAEKKAEKKPPSKKPEVKPEAKPKAKKPPSLAPSPNFTLSIEDEAPVDNVSYKKIEKIEFTLTPEKTETDKQDNGSSISPADYKSGSLSLEKVDAQKKLKLEIDQKLSAPPIQKKPKKKTPVLAKLVLISAIIAACVGLITYNFDTLIQQPSLRAALNTLCPHVGCEVPTYNNISEIETQGLVIAASTTKKDTLDFRIIIKNTSEFEQTFPTIRIDFRNRFNQIEDTLKIAPRQYLRGELSKLELLPSKTPIQIYTTIIYNKPLIGYQVSLVETE